MKECASVMRAPVLLRATEAPGKETNAKLMFVSRFGPHRSVCGGTPPMVASGNDSLYPKAASSSVRTAGRGRLDGRRDIASGRASRPRGRDAVRDAGFRHVVRQGTTVLPNLALDAAEFAMHRRSDWKAATERLIHQHHRRIAASARATRPLPLSAGKAVRPAMR